MDPLISIPRDALADLLRAAGSTMTPEEYAASLPSLNLYKKYPSRAWVAAMSKYCLLVIAVLGVILLPVLGFDLENLVIVAGLITVTVVEYRVHRYFRQNDPRAPRLGFRNQACFAGAILLYCLYHAFAPVQMPLQDLASFEDNDLVDPNLLKKLAPTMYLFIAIVAGGSQYALAWYYRTAQPKG